ncbi:MAG: tRNA-dihydrouridine synthase family protein [Herbinix sp.]|nr:tRNA-dihydrouridine synthase family protein [Herbinix sp.]
MNIYFAPMEGITGYIYRNAHNAYFHSIDKYFSPFIAGKHNQNLKSKEMKDILPENNQGLMLVPQILTNQAKDFIQTSKIIEQLGYGEINLNLGCPSGTVVSKNMGSGFLSKKEELDAFLEEIFSASITKISVKTRIGKEQPEEFYELIEIFNKYPMEELIIHPRVQKDFYKNIPNRKVFRDAMSLSKNHVCYNGNLFTATDYNEFITDFPGIDSIMVGRGLLANPGLIGNIELNAKLDKALLKEFHDRILEDYQKILFGDRNVLFKMKEIWFYMIRVFTNHEKYHKKIKKSEKLCDYERAVTNLFLEQEIDDEQNIFF